MGRRTRLGLTLAALIAIAFGSSRQHLIAGAFDQELHEEGALDRFELDDLLLPTMNVELPELFDWSDADNVYLAGAMPGHDSRERS